VAFAAPSAQSKVTVDASELTGVPENRTHETSFLFGACIANPAEKEWTMTTLISSGSLNQSSFGFDGAHNLEAVITRPVGPIGRFALQHY
jgi:hypothetical protein